MTEIVEAEALKQVLNDWQNTINLRLAEISSDAQPDILYEPIRYVLQGGGKRIRPILLLLTCKALNGDIELCWEAAVAVELLHNFTLVHDDIMDKDDTRRGRQTVHKKWNEDTALLVGDGLLALAYQALLRTRSPRIQTIAQIFTDGMLELCEGQALDLEFETRNEVHLDEYLTMIQKKTARLLSVAAQIGAFIADGNPDDVTAVRDFGFHLGCAFQIQDDLLDITTTEEILGKTHGSDIIRKKKTFLLIHALEHADAETKKRLDEIVNHSTIENLLLKEVLSIYELTGSIAAAKTSVANYFASAENDLSKLKDSPAKNDLRSLVQFIASREN
ncbi:MAG: polyprenyl synthetase family protein [bacterium]